MSKESFDEWCARMQAENEAKAARARRREYRWHVTGDMGEGPTLELMAGLLDKSLSDTRAQWSVVCSFDKRYALLACPDLSACPNAAMLREEMITMIPGLEGGCAFIAIDTCWGERKVGSKSLIDDELLSKMLEDLDMEPPSGVGALFVFNSKAFAKHNQMFFASGHPNHVHWAEAGRIGARYGKNALRLFFGPLVILLGVLSIFSRTSNLHTTTSLIGDGVDMIAHVKHRRKVPKNKGRIPRPAFG